MNFGQHYDVIRRKLSTLRLSSGQWFLVLYLQGLLFLMMLVYLLKFAMRFL